jgi:hypothetical protein
VCGEVWAPGACALRGASAGAGQCAWSAGCQIGQAASPIKRCRETYYSASLSGICWMACAERRGTVTFHPANPATRLIDVAMITAPRGNDSHACRSAVRRICLVWMSVSETWNVMPIVKDR